MVSINSSHCFHSSHGQQEYARISCFKTDEKMPEAWSPQEGGMLDAYLATLPLHEEAEKWNFSSAYSVQRKEQ